MRKITGREKRLLAYLAVLLVILGLDTWRRRWTADITKTTAHYIIYSTATPQQTAEIGVVAEMLYREYIDFIGQLGQSVEPHSNLK